jgi:hypothetical protein
MGHKYMILSWEVDFLDIWQYVVKYEGRSFIKAMVVMFSEKRRGVGCVKFEWR